MDMWALGCVVYELFHPGKQAFQSEEAFELEGLIRKGIPASLARRVPAEARDLILDGLLVVDPHARLTATQVLTQSAWMLQPDALSR